MASSLRISILLGPFLPAGGGPSGAVEKVWMSLAEQFVLLGQRVTCVSRQWPSCLDREWHHGVLVERIPSFRRSKSTLRNLLYDAAYSLRAVRTLPSADITVTNAFWAPYFLKRHKKRFGKIVVNVNRFPKKQMWLYAGVDRLSAASHAVRAAIVKQTPSAAAITKVIPNPIDTKLFHAGLLAMPPSKGARILYTGRIHPEKGVHLLVQACARLSRTTPGLELSLVGEQRVQYGGGGEAYVEWLRSLAGESAVRIEPSIEDPAILAMRMRQADYYCYPSLAETGEAFGVAPLEAMALGFAPILSSLECFIDFATSGRNAFVFDHRYGDIVQNLESAIWEAISNPERTKQMRAEAAEVAKGFSVEKVAEMYLADWRELSSRGRGG